MKEICIYYVTRLSMSSAVARAVTVRSRHLLPCAKMYIYIYILSDNNQHIVCICSELSLDCFICTLISISKEERERVPAKG